MKNECTSMFKTAVSGKIGYNILLCWEKFRKFLQVDVNF